ncbi:MAG TPA: RNA-binding cell elongation regulator Jag/EloR [Clostridia bacterium]|nr:RNA-binding cell elongation regulator Jag/EloR [Clostridia bacterium]
MKYEAIGTGRTVEEAIRIACESLGVEREQVEFEILELPSKRLLGLLGASDAKVKVVYNEGVEDKARNYLKQILEKMELPGVIIESTETEKGINFDLAGEGLGIIIGHRGETLDSLQYLVSLVANKGEEQYKRITIDTGNYREKREKTLMALAKRIALNSIRTKRTTTLEPMNPYERRIIHTAVQEIRGAASWSVGEEPNRRVVIGAENASRAPQKMFRS